MPNDRLVLGRCWRQWLTNHNPLYIFSAWLVLHGVSLAFQGEAGRNLVPLMTQLLCVYILLLALSGCGTLLLALFTSFWRAGITRKVWNWLESDAAPSTTPDVQAP